MGFLSLTILYTVVALIALYMIALSFWQIQILRGKEMKNPDGTVDSYRTNKDSFGFALADVLVATPTTVAAVVLLFLSPRAGHVLMAMIAWWFLWVNIATTAVSLKFSRPKITPVWLLTFPLGSLLGLAYLAWLLVHFDIVFA